MAPFHLSPTYAKKSKREDWRALSHKTITKQLMLNYANLVTLHYMNMFREDKKDYDFESGFWAVYFFLVFGLHCPLQNQMSKSCCCQLSKNTKKY